MTRYDGLALKRWIDRFRGGKSVYWAGDDLVDPAFYRSTALFDKASAFREGSSLHGKFDVIFAFEKNIGAMRQWRLVLDEMIRLLRRGRKTILAMRLMPTVMHRAEVMAFLKQRTDCRFTLLDRGENGLLVLECLREGERPGLSSFGFGIISDGNHVGRLARFADSLTKVRGLVHTRWDLAFCGPASLAERLAPDLSEEMRERTHFIVEPDEWRELGWITRKKNLLVEALEAENILILHDRYVLPPDFLENLELFGADFDLIVPGQERGGRRFPDWTATASEWDMSKTYILPYGEDSRDLYVNGGVLLAKRSVMQRVGGWNDLLGWNESEDVELSRRLRAWGITPRLAPAVRLETIEVRRGYEQAFERTRSDARPMLKNSTFPADGRLDLRGFKSAEDAEAFGLIAWPNSWAASGEGLTARSGAVELTLCRGERAQGSVFLECAGASLLAERGRYWINGQTVGPKVTPDGIELPLEGVPAGAGGQAVITCECGDLPLVVQAIELRDGEGESPEPISYPVAMTDDNPSALRLIGAGWWGLEPWGVWSEGTSSRLNLPAPAAQARKRNFILELDIKTLDRVARSRRIVGVTCNDWPLACLKVRCDGRVRRYRLDLPVEVVAPGQPVRLLLSADQARSPAQGGRSDDCRSIGFGLTRVGLYPTGRWRRGRLFRFNP